MLLLSAAAFRSGTKYSVAQAEAQSNFTNLVPGLRYYPGGETERLGVGRVLA